MNLASIIGFKIQSKKGFIGWDHDDALKIFVLGGNPYTNTQAMRVIC